jgi:hypothetical protein
MPKLVELYKRYLNYLRDLSYDNSEENREFVRNKLIAHRGYMEGYRKTTPYLHPDTWQDDREGRLSALE